MVVKGYLVLALPIFSCRIHPCFESINLIHFRAALVPLRCMACSRRMARLVPPRSTMMPKVLPTDGAVATRPDLKTRRTFLFPSFPGPKPRPPWTSSRGTETPAYYTLTTPWEPGTGAVTVDNSYNIFRNNDHSLTRHLNPSSFDVVLLDWKTKFLQMF